MTIFTPRGLKIRLPFNYAFALIARLYPEVDAFKILKTTEGIESIPSFITFATGLVCFYLRLPLFQIGLYVFIASIAGFLITSYGLYMVPGFIQLGTFYSYIAGYGILLILLSVYGFITIGWLGIAVFFFAKILARIVQAVIEIIQTINVHSKVGLIISESEKNFINAYRLHANMLGKTTDVTVSEEELKEDNWKSVFEDLAIKWPEVVRRFTID